MKCAGRGTRAHHRDCPKRGNRAQSLDALRRWMLARAQHVMERELKRGSNVAEGASALSEALKPCVPPMWERALARTRRSLDGFLGVQADVLGKVAAEHQQRIDAIMRDSWVLPTMELLKPTDEAWTLFQEHAAAAEAEMEVLQRRMAGGHRGARNGAGAGG